jgi:hypothetical protein
LLLLCFFAIDPAYSIDAFLPAATVASLVGYRESSADEFDARFDGPLVARIFAGDRGDGWMEAFAGFDAAD